MVKAFWQTLHRNGLSPVCVRIWICKAELDEKFLLHTWHKCFVFCCWEFPDDCDDDMCWFWAWFWAAAAACCCCIMGDTPPPAKRTHSRSNAMPELGGDVGKSIEKQNPKNIVWSYSHLLRKCKKNLKNTLRFFMEYFFHIFSIYWSL